MSRYRISVKALQGTILTFHVQEYKVIDGDFIEFFDSKTNVTKKFHASNCEITEVAQ